MIKTPRRDNGRWRYGLVIDGNKLSNRYSINPYAFTGTSRNIRIKSITEYDSGKHLLEIVNWGNRPNISKALYDEIKEAILNLPDSYKEKKRFEYKGVGKIKTPNGKIVEQYKFNVPSRDSGDIFKQNKFNNMSSLTKSDRFNEKEERIWTDQEMIDIQGCILGIILPYNEYKEYVSSNIEDPELKATFDICNKFLGTEYIKIFY